MSYTQQQFQKDLNELTRLISSYQTGGKRSSKKRGGSRKSRGGSMGKRSFRVVKLDGVDVSADRNWLQRYYHGTAENDTPNKAAEHAFSKGICRAKKMIGARKGQCKASFSIKETTKGSVHKTYGPYLGKMVKLNKPVSIKRKQTNGSTQTVEYKYKPDVSLSKNKK